MLPKKSRVPKKLFPKNNSKFLSFHSDFFSLKIFLTKHTNEVRFSCPISKKVSKTAVSRNKLRRKFYSSAKESSLLIPSGALVIFYPKKTSLSVKQKDLIIEMKNVFTKITFPGVLKKKNNNV